MPDRLSYSDNGFGLDLAHRYVSAVGHLIPDESVSKLRYTNKAQLVHDQLIDNPFVSLQPVLTPAEAKTALEQKQILAACMCYRNVEDLHGPLYGGEFLMRRFDPARGVGGISHFFESLRAQQLHTPAYMNVLDQACAVAGATHDSFVSSVNMTSSMLAQPDFTSRIQSAIDSAHIPATQLKLELIEYIEHLTDDNIRTLRKILDMDVGLCIDDYGEGHSKNLLETCISHKLPVGTIKVSADIGTNGDLEHECTDLLRMIDAAKTHTLIFEGRADALLTPAVVRNLREVRSNLYSTIPWLIEGPVYPDSVGKLGEHTE